MSTTGEVADDVIAAKRVERTIAILEAHGLEGHDREVRSAYTDACAEVLLIEAERLRAKRRLIAELADAGQDPGAAERAESHAARVDRLGRELRALRVAIRRLGALLPLAS